MDKNSITGVILIILIVVGYNALFPPVIEVEAEKSDNNTNVIIEQASVNKETNTSIVLDTSELDDLHQRTFGVFAPSAKGSDKDIIIENDVMKLSISPKGGRIVSAILKDYQTTDSLPLNLIDRDSSAFNIIFFSEGNRIINSQHLYFKSVDKSDRSVAMRMMASNGGYLEYVYQLNDNDYMIDFKINTVGLEKIIPSNRNDFELKWSINLPSTEKSIENERMYSTVYFKYLNDEVDYISETKDDEVSLEGKAQWIGLKHQFFSSVLINNNGFEKPTSVKSTTKESSTNFVKNLEVETQLAYNHNSRESLPLKLYLGPNHYETLSAYNMDLERMIPLGWGIFRWVNKYAVIPIFNWLDNSITNYGIIILIMTLIIKMALAPFTLKAYRSQAKMKVLKPEIDKINEKNKEKDPMKAQQATMALYKRAGVNPLGGCVPMILQMPILFALFRFFPWSTYTNNES